MRTSQWGSLKEHATSNADHDRGRDPARTGPESIAVVARVLGGFYFGAALDSITRVASEHGHGVIALQTLAAGLDRGEEHVTPLRMVVAEHQVGGYIVMTNAVCDDELQRIRSTGKPLVLISAHAEGLEVPVVLPDNAMGIASAVEHLVEHGHRRIGFIGHLWLTDAQERYAAYDAALRTHGIVPDPAWVFPARDNLEEGGADAGRLMLAAGMPTSAVIVATDRNAAGLIRVLRSSGLTLPADQAIVAFDNAELGVRLNPPLTTVDQHIGRVSALAATLMVAQLRGEQVAAGVYRTPTDLLVRESCGCTRRQSAARAGADDGALKPSRRFTVAVKSAVGAPASETGADPAAGPANALTESIEAAALGRPLPPARAARIADALYALAPHEEPIGEILVAVRRFERDLERSIAPDLDRARTTLRDAVTDVIAALAAAPSKALLRRVGRLEASLAHQYEIDLDLLRRGRDDPRTLSWLPSSRVSAACLGLWSGTPDAEGNKMLEIVGVHDPSRRLASLVGRHVTARSFPPKALCELGPQRAHNALFVVPVSIDTRDWGLLALFGTVEFHGTSARDNYNHWAALLAVALDEESVLEARQQQQVDLSLAYRREQTLVQHLQVSQERYVMAADAASDGLWDWDVSAGTVYYSPRWAALLGLSHADLGNAPTEWLDRVHPDDTAAVSTAIAAQFAGHRGVMEIEHRLRTADGSYRWVLCRARTVFNEAASPSRLVGAITDMTDRRELEEQLRRGALYDGETGLANRVLFHDRLDRAIAGHRVDAARAVCVVLIRLASARQDDGVDGVGGIDGVDVEVASELPALRSLGKRLQVALADEATVGWLGSGELAVLLEGRGPRLDPHVLLRLLAQLRSLVTSPSESDAIRQVACGSAEARDRHTSASELLQDAHIDLQRNVARGVLVGRVETALSSEYPPRPHL